MALTDRRLESRGPLHPGPPYRAGPSGLLQRQSRFATEAHERVEFKSGPAVLSQQHGSFRPRNWPRNEPGYMIKSPGSGRRSIRRYADTNSRRTQNVTTIATVNSFNPARGYEESGNRTSRIARSPNLPCKCTRFTARPSDNPASGRVPTQDRPAEEHAGAARARRPGRRCPLSLVTHALTTNSTCARRRHMPTPRSGVAARI